MDSLTEVLRSVRLSGGAFLHGRFTAPWSVVSHMTPDDCAIFLPGAVQVIGYHFVVAGRFLLSVQGEPPVEVNAGEVVLLPRNDQHILASAAGLKPVVARELINASDDGLFTIDHGGGGEPTHIVCGFLASDYLYSPLIATLPRVLKLDIRDGTSRAWVEASMRFAADEMAKGRVGEAGIMSRLSELLLVEAVRTYASTLPQQEAGWLQGLADPRIGKALAAMHQNPRKRWSADQLAKEAGLSRSAFVERFTALVGVPPIRYLTAWRLQTAKLNLRETQQSIAQLAYTVGYESEEAFSRAFKREFGSPPARWRTEQAAL